MKKSRFSTTISLYVGNDTKQGHRYYMERYRNLYPMYRILTYPMTLCDLEWLRKIFNDTKHRATSLRQLSLLYIMYVGNSFL